MDPELPDWVTEEYFRKLLKKQHNSSHITIEEIKIDRPIPKGDNYVCNIFRMDVRYIKKNGVNKLFTTSFIIKAMIKGKMYLDMQKTGMTKRESRIYKELVPKLKKIFKDVRDEEFLLPKSFDVFDDETVVLEDLKTKGYMVADRMKQLDFEHASLAIKALAKFHAGTVVVDETEPELLSELGKEVILNDELKFINETFIINSFEIIANAIDKWCFEGQEKYSEWFRDNKHKAWDKLVACVKPKQDELNVLNHGDFWTANMMFKFADDGKTPSDVKLIDLQICRYTSPVIDFFYLIYSSVQDDVRIKYYDTFITVYTEQFNSSLEKFGSKKRMRETEFKRIHDERIFFVLFVSINLLPVVIANPKETEIISVKDVSLDELKELGATDENPLVGYYKGKRYIEIMTKRLVECKNKGIIDL